MATIVISGQGLDGIVAQYRALPRQIDAAKRRAVSKVTRAIPGAAARMLAPVLGVAQKHIRGRLAAKVTNGEGVAWFGLNPLGVTQRGFGNLRQDKAGARAGRLAFKGAFVATMPSGHVAVFRRKGAARLPIATETIPMDTPATRAIVVAQARLAKERLAKVFGQELNYETRVKGAR